MTQASGAGLPPDVHRSRGVTPRDIAGVTLVAAALVSSWTGLSVAGLKPVDWLLFLTLLLIGLDLLATAEMVVLPVWAAVGSAGLLGLVILNEMWPISPDYLTGRFVSALSQVTPGLQGGSASNGLQWFAALCVLPLLTVAVARFQPRYISRIAVAWMIGIAVSCLVAITDFKGWTNLSAHWVQYPGAGLRQAGLTVHSNNVGVGAAMGMPIALWVMNTRRQTGFLLACLLIAGAVVSGSRGGQAGIALAIAATVILVARSRRLVPKFLALAIISLVAIQWLAPEWLTRVAFLFRFGSAGAQESDLDRRSRRAQGFIDFHQRPFVGIGFKAMNDAHSIYLQVLAVGGFLLAGCLAIYMVGALRSAWYERATDGSVAPYLGVSVLTWLAVGLVENQLTDRYLYVPIACLAAYSALRRWGLSPCSPKLAPVRAFGADPDSIASPSDPASIRS